MLARGARSGLLIWFAFGSCVNGAGAERTGAVALRTFSDIRLLKVKLVLGIGGGTCWFGKGPVIVDVAAKFAALCAYPVGVSPFVVVCNHH